MRDRPFKTIHQESDPDPREEEGRQIREITKEMILKAISRLNVEMSKKLGGFKQVKKLRACDPRHMRMTSYEPCCEDARLLQMEGQELAQAGERKNIKLPQQNMFEHVSTHF